MQNLVLAQSSVYINGTLVEDKMRTVHSSVNVHNLASVRPCGPVYTLDGASAKFNTNSHEMDNSIGGSTSYCQYPTLMPEDIDKVKVPFS